MKTNRTDEETFQVLELIKLKDRVCTLKPKYSMNFQNLFRISNLNEMKTKMFCAYKKLDKQRKGYDVETESRNLRQKANSKNRNKQFIILPFASSPRVSFLGFRTQYASLPLRT